MGTDPSCIARGACAVPRAGTWIMVVDYKPVGKGRKVVAVLRMVDGKPEREIRMRKYVRMLRAARKVETQETLKPLKNVLRDYLKSNPDYARVLRFKDAPRGRIHITDGKYVLKQLELAELRQLIANNALFAETVPYRQIARQTDNYRATGDTEQDARPRGPLGAVVSGVRGGINRHPVFTLAVAGALVAATLAAVVIRDVRARRYGPVADFTSGPAADRTLARYETEVRALPALAAEDPEVARQTLREIEEFLPLAERQALSPEQTKRLYDIKMRLRALAEQYPKSFKKR